MTNHLLSPSPLRVDKLWMHICVCQDSEHYPSLHHTPFVRRRDVRLCMFLVCEEKQDHRVDCKSRKQKKKLPVCVHTSCPGPLELHKGLKFQVPFCLCPN